MSGLPFYTKIVFRETTQHLTLNFSSPDDGKYLLKISEVVGDSTSSTTTEVSTHYIDVNQQYCIDEEIDRRLQQYSGTVGNSRMVGSEDIENVYAIDKDNDHTIRFLPRLIDIIPTSERDDQEPLPIYFKLVKTAGSSDVKLTFYRPLSPML